MDEPTRRAWSKPELIVLVRGGPEEAVLVGCKDLDTLTGSTAVQDGCRYRLCAAMCLEVASS